MADEAAPIGVDVERGIELFRSPQRPAGAEGPEQHVSLAGAELHSHPESCCCHAPCESSACHVPGSHDYNDEACDHPDAAVLSDVSGWHLCARCDAEWWEDPL